VRIGIVGCGAVGSLFAANLATLDDVDVWAYDLNTAHVEAINARGLRLSGAGEVIGRLQATSDPTAMPPCELGIVATKAMYADTAVAEVAHAFSGGSLASVMNGIGNEETLARHVAHVIRGTTFPAGRLVEPGHVQWDVRGDTTFGPFEGRPAPGEDVARLADACTRAGMPARAAADARPVQWRKVIFNAASNPVGALTGLTHGQLCERPDLRGLVHELVVEGLAVAAAQGIEPDQDPEALIDHAARRDVAYGHKASTLQDVEARRPTEIDYLNGGIARVGDELGVPTPLNDAITALIKGIEASWS
jgi:2-dehydropantoate 2-reductase